MSESTQCPQCAAPLPTGWPKGLCSRCALQGALELSDGQTEVLQPEGPPAPSTSGQPAAHGSLGTLKYFGDYELLEEIARGGMGIVYKARQKSLDRIVAVKLLLLGQYASEEFIHRFRIEASAAASLQHPNIVAIHEVGVHQGQHYFAMDFVDGPNLAQLVRDQPLAPKRAAGYVKTIAEAIHFAHTRRILHRDLKPSNVLIDANDQPRVTDFGLAKKLSDDSDLTVTGQVLGSPSFLPPEQALGERGKMGPASDVYSLGAILYHALTGRPPFVGQTLADTLKQVETEDPISPRLLIPSIPADLETICLKCLEKEPGKRYQTAQQLAYELGRFQNGEPIHARPVGQTERLWRWCRRQPKLAAAMGIAAGLLVTVAIVSTGAAWRIQQAREGERRNRILAEQAEVHTRENLYVADMNLAQHALDEGNMGRVRTLIEAHRPNPGKPDVRGFEWRHLWAASRSEAIATWHGHTAVVKDLAFSPDGKTLLSGGQNGFVRFWDFATGVPFATLPRFGTLLYSVAFSPDGLLFAVGCQVEGASLWNTERRERIARLGGTNSTATFSPDGKWLAIANRTDFSHGHGTDTLLWNVREGRLERTFENAGVCAAFSRDGALLALGSAGGVIKVWHLAEGRVVATLRRAKPTAALAFSADSHQLVVSYCDGRGDVQVWDLKRQEIGRPLQEHAAMVWDVSFSPDGRMLATASSDQTVRLWDVSRWEVTKVLRGHGDEVWRAEFTPDGKRLVTGSKDETIMIWSLASTHQVDDIPDARSSVILSPDSSLLTAVDREGVVALWDTGNARRLREFRGEKKPLAFLEGGKLLVTFQPPLTLTFWNLPAGDIQAQTSLHHDRAVKWVKISPDGKMLATGNGDFMVRLWNAATGEPQGVLLDQIGSEGSCAFSPDGRLFFSATRSAVSTYDRTTLRSLATVKGHSMDVSVVTPSPDGLLLATGSVDGTVAVWEVAGSRQLMKVANNKGGGIGGLTFSPDNKTLVTGNSLDDVWWNVKTAREVVTYPGKRTLSHPRFSADGRLFTITDAQKGCLLIRAPSLAEIAAGELPGSLPALEADNNKSTRLGSINP